mmetsp:Transcript_30435/g.69071  ORF Transcript_30435/g.69071 Transcript_30435/m.69071 type:complete len:184 (-) Transcript_30435:120-671(-)
MIEVDTKKQIQAMIAYDSLSHMRVMPDCRVGHGCCVGFTSVVACDKVVPSFVGGDIGCGILTYPLNKTKMNLERLDRRIRALIPMGVGREHIYNSSPMEQSFIERYLDRAQESARQFAAGRGVSAPTLDYNYFTTLCGTIGIDVDLCIRSFGTLGGGTTSSRSTRTQQSNSTSPCTAGRAALA